MKTKQFVLVLFAVLFIYSCEKKEEVTIEEINLTEEVAKIETSYKEGDIKIETTFGLNDKVETVADKEYIEELLKVVGKSYSKQKTYLKSVSTYYTKGIFKNTTCGNYKELEIFMDCEDRGNTSAEVEGNGGTGASSVDHNGNVSLKVCVVDDVYFGPYWFNHYGILNLGVQEPNVSRLVRGFDNEDSGNANKAWLDGVPYTGTMGDCNIGSTNPNTKLSFTYRDGNCADYANQSGYNGNYMPNIGFSYYVLANWHTGYIYTDDEDRRNANYWFYDPPSLNDPPLTVSNGTVDGVLGVGANTTIHLSKVN